MILFKSKAEKELDFLLAELKNYLSNNYKDAAHSCRKQLLEKAEQYFEEGKLSQVNFRKYQQQYAYYTKLMEKYQHTKIT